MSALRFCFVLHIHQPVGNFEHVFREHADDVYRPFFDFLDERELWPIGLHVSGPLLEWLGDHDSAFHDRIGRRVADGQIEMLSSGLYEPVLACLSREDRATQLGWMREELERRFGATPTGLWLTERVWEPDLPRDLADAGIQYTLLDDQLLLRAGARAEDLQRPLRTEAGGRRLDLLSIDQGLRYLIPFRPAHEIEADLRRRQAAGDTLALIGDDGEKFGGWPRTKEWLYEGGWLADFGDRMDALRSEGVVRLVTPAGARAELQATGPLYVPSGSYSEMEGWALGGHWKGFLGRYAEANRIHKRMSALSLLCQERGDPAEVRRAIGRAQCNDAYWHGVFGGLYMKHLRQGVRDQLLLAERMLRAGEALASSEGDIASDGQPTWWIHGENLSAWVTGEHGGTVTDLMWLDRGTDVLDVLTRRREAYHEEALRRTGADAASTESRDGQGHADSSTEGGDTSAPSIHEIESRSILDRLPPIDPETRTLVRDRVLTTDTTFEDYRDGLFTPLWIAPQAGSARPEPVVVSDGGAADGSSKALLWRFSAPGQSVEKTIQISEEGTVTLSWSWDPAAFPAGSVFAPELSLGAPAHLEFTPEPTVWSYPIITVSKCPDGFEEIEQGDSVTPRWPIAAGRASVVIAGVRS